MGRGKSKSKKPNDNNEEIEFKLNIPKLNYYWIIIALFIVLGFSLRFYHVNYPVVGYHNWKTTHYITEARNFAREGFFKYGFFVPMRDSMGTPNEPSDGQHYDTFPTISIVVGFFFMIFGESLLVARLVNIFFSLGSVVMIYMLIKKLFDNESLALATTFLAAINPLYVFFSHNVQMVNPGFFLMLAGAYFYVSWIKDKMKKPLMLFLATFFIALSSMTKYTFAVIAIPILFSFPYKEFIKNIKKHQKTLIITGLIALMFPMWFFYSENYVKKNIFLPGKEITGKFSISNLVDFKLVTDGNFWNTMKFYIADNFTLFGIFLAFLGSGAFTLLFLSKNKNKFSHKFMFGYLISVFIFVFVMGFKLSGHNYHQFPVSPVVLFMIAFFIEFVAKNISNMISRALDQDTKFVSVGVYLFIFFIIVFAPISSGKSLFAHSIESKNRMFGTQFPGLDMAGYYINQNSEPSERIYHSSGQSFGVLWHADRKGYKGSNTEDYYKLGEDNFNVTWVFAYQYNGVRGIEVFIQNEESLNYLQNNYKLVQAAFLPGQTNVPLYFLFKKGGTSDLSDLNALFQDKQVKSFDYTRPHPDWLKSMFMEQQVYQILVIDLE